MLDDGNRALVGFDDLSLRLWSLDSEEEKILADDRTRFGAVERTSCAQGGKLGFAGRGEEIFALDLERGSVGERVAVTGNGLHRFARSPMETCFWGCDDGLITFKPERRRKALRGHSGPVTAIANLRGGHRALSGSSRDGTLRLWDLQSGQQIGLIRGFSGKSIVHAQVPNLDCVLIGSTVGGLIHVCSLASGEVLGVLDEHRTTVEQLAADPDMDTALSCSRDGTICSWDLQNLTLRQRFQHADGPVRSLVFPFGAVRRCIRWSADVGLGSKSHRMDVARYPPRNR